MPEEKRQAYVNTSGAPTCQKSRNLFRDMPVISGKKYLVDNMRAYAIRPLPGAIATWFRSACIYAC